MSTLRVAQIRSKIKENGFRAHNFPRLRRAERGFAFGTVLVSPKSATLTVTIIPVSPEGGSPPQAWESLWLRRDTDCTRVTGVGVDG